MIIGMIFSSFIAYFLNSYWSGKMVNYPVKEQVLDIAPSFIIAMIMGISVYVLGNSLSLQPIITLCIEIPVGALIALGIARLIKLDAYMEIRDIVLEKLTA